MRITTRDRSGLPAAGLVRPRDGLTRALSWLARIVFWLKLWNSAAFAIVAFAMDRLLRSDPARRLRAHLLWTINPLLLWDLVAAGHIDVLAAAAGMLGLLALGEHSASRPGIPRVLAAGALIGVAADIKINYALFGLGLAWALRRTPSGLVAAAGAALMTLLPGYLWFGPPAARALLNRRNGTSADNFYRFFVLSPHWRAHLSVAQSHAVQHGPHHRRARSAQR
jgi:hypothetical protein